MRKTYKIGEVANILGVSADTIRYYEKAGIVYSKKDPSNGYRYFTPADIYALLDVLFYRSMDIPVEEVRNIMNSYQHRDVKKLLEQKQEQVQAKIREQQVLLERIRATIEDYRIMEENLDVFQVRPMPSMILFHESPADNQAYFNNMIEQENQNPSQAVGSLIESGFIAARGGNSDGSYGNSFVYNGDPVFPGNFLSHLHQVFGVGGDFVVHFLTGAVDVRVTAGQKRNPHRNGPDIQMLLFDHLDRFHNILHVNHGHALP